MGGDFQHAMKGSIDFLYMGSCNPSYGGSSALSDMKRHNTDMVMDDTGL